jgi:hypothetical protein
VCVVFAAAAMVTLVSLSPVAGQGGRTNTPPLDRRLPGRVGRVYKALAKSFSPSRAMDVVTFMSKGWRLAGNPAFEASQERISRELADAGFRVVASAGDATVAATSMPGRSQVGAQWYEEFALSTPAWQPLSATIAIVDTTDEVRRSGTPTSETSDVRSFGPSDSRTSLSSDLRTFGPRAPDSVVLDISRPLDSVSLCINSFSTPAGGVRAPLVFVGRGTDASDYANVDVRGAIVLGQADARRLFDMAVRQRGAVGVLSDSAADYTAPDETPDVVQWSGVPYDEKLQAFGFKVSRRLVSLLKTRMASGPVMLKVDIATAFQRHPSRTLVAEIPGRTRPAERVVIVAHVQEPGANDNASGCATLMEIARALAAGVARGTIPPPARTLTFLWGDEISASRQWLRADASRAGSVRHAFSLDMTGEDVTKTGGTFLIEKQPDPSAVWVRPSDPHTEWGRGAVAAETLKGNLLNDVHLAVCLRRARDTGWVVKANPYEGGSDHSVFLASGVPALLDWHFTDRYYHTNLDTPDKTSPAEMANVGIAMGTTAWLLASADADEARAIVDLVKQAALARLALEARQSAEAMAEAAGSPEARAKEETIFAAWQKWYVEALQSVLTLPAGEPGARLTKEVEKAVARVRAAKLN